MALDPELYATLAQLIMSAEFRRVLREVADGDPDPERRERLRVIARRIEQIAQELS